MNIRNIIKQSAAALVIAAISFAGCDKEPEKPVVKVTGVKLDRDALSVDFPGEAKLTATVEPADVTNKEVTWSINPLDVAAIGDNGEVMALKPGTATITVSTDDGGYTATCEVTVQVAVTGVTLNKPTLTLVAGASETLIATVAPDNAANKTVTWAVTEGDAATVDQNGKVIAVKAGTATVTVTAAAGFTATCTVIVSEPENAMTMTTAIKGEVGIYLAGTGTAVIYWSDGSAPETVTLKTFVGEFSDAYRYPHSFSGTDSRTIVIDGQNITHIACNQLQLTVLDITKNTKLTYLRCNSNELTSLDVSKNTALKDLNCGANHQLTSLDVTNNTALTKLICSNSALTTLDVSKNTALKYLDCYFNQLTSLDVTKNIALEMLFCRDNKFTAEGLNTLFGTLHTNVGKKEIWIRGNPGTAGCDRTIATAKGWTVVMN